MAKKMLFVLNPHTAGSKIKNKLLEILCAFSGDGYEICIHITRGRGDALDMVARQGGEFDLVVCCGGDGTLNEVVNGLMRHDPVPRLGYIPGGTTNDFASSLCLPKSNMTAAATRIINPKKVFQCDVGQFGRRHFNYVAAFGAFTDVSYSTPQKSKNLLGYIAYILEGAQQLGHLQAYRARMDWGEGECEGEYLFGMIANSSSIGGFSFLPMQKKVLLDDGLFEMVLVQKPHSLSQLRDLSAALVSKSIESPLVTAVRVNKVTFFADDEVAWTLDGEYGGSHQSVDIRVKQKALPICV